MRSLNRMMKRQSSDQKLNNEGVKIDNDDKKAVMWINNYLKSIKALEVVGCGNEIGSL